MILTVIFVAISLAANVFMLTFLNATVKELRPTGTRVVEIRSNAGVGLKERERLDCQDRAA
ncbi:MAG: hypothetical protein DMG80_03865 [Acidobacteria bacterium]|nr:MAG: hypothetical protein DMG80_03865 [Acidobacteriota bacterium]